MLSCKVEKVDVGAGTLLLENSEGDKFWIDAHTYEEKVRGLEGYYLGFEGIDFYGLKFKLPSVGWNTIKAKYQIPERRHDP